MEKEKDYNEDTQKLFLTLMLSDPTAFALSQSIILPDYFDDKLKGAVRFILGYYSDYTALPSYEMVQAQAGLALERVEAAQAEQHRSWYLDEIEAFCRHKALERIILDGFDLIDSGRYGDMERRVKDAMLISLQRDLGTDYFVDPKGRLTLMRERNHYISTGWKTLDEKLYGGFSRGSLNVFAGGPGSGKSLFLQNLALNYVFGGYEVVYFTLELSEDLVSMRLDAMVSGMPTKEIFKRLDDVDLKVRMRGKEAGKLQVKKMPEAGTTTNNLRAYLKEYEIQTGRKVDVIIVDYLDLMHPNNRRIDPSDLFVKDKYTSEEMRALADEMHAIGITASQLNRQSIEAMRDGMDFDQSHIAGGISKINTADNVFGIWITQAMRERGEYQLQFLKTRTSSAVGQKMTLKYDPASLRISDAEKDLHKPRSMEEISKELKEEVKDEKRAEGKSLNEAMGKFYKLREKTSERI